MSCEYCLGERPIVPGSYDPDTMGNNPGITIEPTYNIDTMKSGYLIGFLRDLDEDLYPDAQFKFDYCPICGEKLGDE